MTITVDGCVHSARAGDPWCGAALRPRDRLAERRERCLRAAVSDVLVVSDGPSEGSVAAEDLLALAARADPARRRVLLDRVVVETLPVARALAHRYDGHGETLEDLVQVAALALVRAVHRYEPGRGRGLLPYAVPSITGELRRHLRDRAWGVRPPRRLQELRAALGAASAELVQRHGRSPTTAELAIAVGAAPAEVEEALAAAQALSLTSLDAALEGSDDGSSLRARLGQDDPRYEDVVERESVRGLLTSLTARDRRILELRYRRGWTQARIAVDVGVTQMQVSRLLTRMLAQVRAELVGEAA